MLIKEINEIKIVMPHDVSVEVNTFSSQDIQHNETIIIRRPERDVVIKGYTQDNEPFSISFSGVFDVAYTVEDKTKYVMLGKVEQNGSRK